jgi:hypothetical protein
VDTPTARHVEIVGTTIRYQQFTPATFKRKFDLRTNEILAGYAHATEQFGDVDVHRNDVFVGLAVRGLRVRPREADAAAGSGPLDVELQPTLFLGDQEGTDHHGNRVSRLSNAQYRTFLTFLYRLIDDENASTLAGMNSLRAAHLAFLEVVVPVAHDIAVEGPDGFENVRVGVSLAAKAIVAADTRRFSYLGATILAEAGYRFQEYYRIGDDTHLCNLSLKIGF